MKARAVAVSRPLDQSQTPEDLMVYCARVSSPSNQHALDTGAKLLKYCIKNGHWSVFEQADLTIELETSRAIAAQLLRHRSFTFQEFSQRYAVADLGHEDVEARMQDSKNRQSSTPASPMIDDAFREAHARVWGVAKAAYDEAIGAGIAKEVARFLLPLSTTTRLYMKGTVRSWIHYFEVRTKDGVQKEHRELALEARDVFSEHFPITSEALGYVRRQTIVDRIFHGLG